MAVAPTTVMMGRTSVVDGDLEVNPIRARQSNLLLIILSLSN